MAKEVANEGDALVLGGICQTPTYLTGMGKEAVQDMLRKQIEVFIQNKVDFLLCEVGNGRKPDGISSARLLHIPLNIIAVSGPEKPIKMLK